VAGGGGGAPLRTSTAEFASARGGLKQQLSSGGGAQWGAPLRPRGQNVPPATKWDV
jgi:hypothetical protein